MSDRLGYAQSLRFAQLHFERNRVPDDAALDQLDVRALRHIASIITLARNAFPDARAAPFWAYAAKLVGEMLATYERAEAQVARVIEMFEPRPPEG